MMQTRLTARLADFVCDGDFAMLSPEVQDEKYAVVARTINGVSLNNPEEKATAGDVLSTILSNLAKKSGNKFRNFWFQLSPEVRSFVTSMEDPQSWRQYRVVESAITTCSIDNIRLLRDLGFDMGCSDGTTNLLVTGLRYLPEHYAELAEMYLAGIRKHEDAFRYAGHLFGKNSDHQKTDKVLLREALRTPCGINTLYLVAKQYPKHPKEIHEVVEWMLSHGAQPMKKTSNDFTVIDRLISESWSDHYQDQANIVFLLARSATCRQLKSSGSFTRLLKEHTSLGIDVLTRGRQSKELFDITQMLIMGFGRGGAEYTADNAMRLLHLHANSAPAGEPILAPLLQMLKLIGSPEQLSVTMEILHRIPGDFPGYKISSDLIDHAINVAGNTEIMHAILSHYDNIDWKLTCTTKRDRNLSQNYGAKTILSGILMEALAERIATSGLYQRIARDIELDNIDTLDKKITSSIRGGRTSFSYGANALKAALVFMQMKQQGDASLETQGACLRDNPVRVARVTPI